MNVRTKSHWGIAVSAFVIGGAAVVFRLLTGHRHADYGSYVPWGLWVGVYVYLVWLEVGTLVVFAGLVHVFGMKRLETARKHVLLFGGIVLLGALAQIGLDLGHLPRFWRTFVTPNFSAPMTWMIWLHTIYLVILGTELRFALRAESEPTAERRAHQLSVLTIPFGAVLVSVVGAVFGVESSRPLWSGMALPLFFLLSSLVIGSAMVTLVYALAAPDRGSAAHTETMRLLGRIVLGLVLFGAFAVVVNVATILSSGATASAESVRTLLGGRHSWSLWLVHVLFGLALPVWLLTRRVPSRRALATAAGLVVLGFMAVPVNLIVAPLVQPEFAALPAAYSGPGLSFGYFPTAVEWLVSMWVLAAVTLGLLVGSRWLRRRGAAVVQP
ncbi:NrfD/PsrC family molybdoenzyme membrane anchor subunit [Anaeromyxobacter sp. PSR-1]|uniref:NrfD/PsrC family molybdoenzyme membrane anchor subunit n=1 Tax=Anaeromyxobacter sp. PSR-1 TaxID=1300915 RepID=UPI0005E982B2|nr:NrfD/PsrC family molybdoenzyme membrane anchor subunit [Anaeromyxobacter sp. PSR-1]GAO01467.1 putative hydrogenase 2 b cytochrome subunit [Anaeromyxobacter sp. PSR-1]